ncbi:GNAT family N-acetyltransferase [Guptibacillus algicola]|uniref:GNAT family N-acetyltransferase n=1 Tax=Guptibacillus algicola TaxID=225844 RepID=UPI001CD7DEB9|nr:GNAT family N-acetyltransferase [Alkalihalobacillus algicola]MCA0987034.1 GNAT family N-acetyltransferase [Alkalihalobacillus algicola]
MKSLQIQPLLETDAGSISRLIESGIKHNVFPLTIYSSPKYSEFVKKSMSNSVDVKFFGAYYENHLLGFTEWRITDNQLFLNNIATSKKARGLGIGRKLYHHGLSSLERRSMICLALDVFDDNIFAKAWYEKMGFEQIDLTHWYTSPQNLIERREGGNFHITNFDQAKEHHGKYGFSVINIATSIGEYGIGRINSSHFRISDKCLLDTDLLVALKEIDEDRNLLLLSKQSSVDGFKKVSTSHRMRKGILHQVGGI